MGGGVRQLVGDGVIETGTRAMGVGAGSVCLFVCFLVCMSVCLSPLSFVHVLVRVHVLRCLLVHVLVRICVCVCVSVAECSPSPFLSVVQVHHTGWLPCDAHLVHVARPERPLPYPTGVPEHAHDNCEAYGVEGAERVVAVMKFDRNGIVQCVYDLATGKEMSERGTWMLWRDAGVVYCPLGYGAALSP